MERFRDRESSLMFGYSPSRSFSEDPRGSSSKSSFSDAVVDFHDVFGGPPRRVSIQERRYSFHSSDGGGSVEEGVGVSRRGSDEAAVMARRCPWGGLGFGEKPVFGEGSGGALRRKTSDDFFDDIFRGDGDLGGLTGKRVDRDLYSSSLPADGFVKPIGETFGNSPVALQSSIPAKLSMGTEVPVFSSVSSQQRNRENYPPSPTPPSYRLSRHASQNHGDLANEAQLLYRQSPLSIQFSFANDGSVKVTKGEEGEGKGEDVVKQNSTISDNLLNSGQFHFSIYKWASKGAPPMIPIRGGVNFRLREKSIKKSSDDDGKLEVVDESEQAAVNLPGEGLASASDIEFKESKSPRPTMNEKSDEPTTASTRTSKVVLDEVQNQNVEETKVNGADPLISSTSVVQDISDDFSYPEIRDRRKTGTAADLKKLDIKEDENMEAEKGNQKPGLITATLENEGQADNQTIAEVGGKPKGTTIFSRFASLGSYIRKQDLRGAISDTNSDVDKTSVPSSPGDSSRKKKVKEKVKEFVEMFSLDSPSKSKMDAETHSQSSELNDKGINKTDGSVFGSLKKVGKDISKPKLDKKFESSNTSQMVDKKKIKAEIISVVDDKKQKSPNASAKSGKDIGSPKAKKVVPHITESAVDRKSKHSAAPISDQKKESFEPATVDKNITPPAKVKMDSPKAKKFASGTDDNDTDTNSTFQVPPTMERIKEAYKKDSVLESKKPPSSKFVKVDKKMELPSNLPKVDGYRKQDKQNYRKESSTTVHKDALSKQKDVSSPVTGSPPDVYQDATESLFDPIDAFEIKELTEELSNLSRLDEYQQALQDADAKIRQWSRGKEGNIRSLLSTLQHVLWPESGWKPVALMDIIEANQVKRTYQRALLCLHPDKLQQKGAAELQKYIAGKVFDILQESWNHFNTLTSL